MHYTYNLNDVRVTLNPAPPGENAKSRQYEYYVWGNIKSVCEITGASNGYSCGQNTAANGFLTSYWYNPLGQLLSVSQSGQSRTFTYDGLGRMTQQIDPESGTTTLSYDSVNDGHCSGSYSGDKVERADAASNISCYTWDGLHRLTGVNYVSGPNAANTPNKGYIYDQSSLGTGYPVPTYPAGRLVLAYTSYQGTWTSWEAFGYNARGDTTDAYFRYYPAAGSSIYHVQQSYYPDEATMSLQGFIGNGTTTPFSHAFGFALEGEGRPYGVWDSTENGETVYGPTTYNPFGEPTQVSIVGGQESFQYDPNSARMTQWSSVTANTQTGNLTWNANASLQSLAITDNGNSGNSQTCSYIYDDEERISSAQCGTNGSIWSQTFQYDFFGNIWKNGTSSWTPASYTNNRASSITYDGMGNASSDGANRYTYDAEGRPLTVGSAQITYDAFGRAVVENKNGTATNIVYSPTGQKFGFMNGSTVEQYFVPMPAGMQAVFNGNGLQYFRHSDWLGSSRFASNAADGSIYYDSAYAPFGENYAEMGTSDRSFTGQTQDTVSGLYDFLFRQQSSAQGRWLVPDPAGMAAVDITNPQTWNRYAYVANNPLSNTDPLGLIFGSDDPGACDEFGDCNSDFDCGTGWACPIINPCIFSGDCGGHQPPPCHDCGVRNPPPGNTTPTQQPINFPNETLGLPNGFPTNPWGLAGAIIPSGNCGDITCAPIGSGFGPGGVISSAGSLDPGLLSLIPYISIYIGGAYTKEIWIGGQLNGWCAVTSACTNTATPQCYSSKIYVGPNGSCSPAWNNYFMTYRFGTGPVHCVGIGGLSLPTGDTSSEWCTPAQ
jgi:RHS repeat-associated protein